MSVTVLKVGVAKCTKAPRGTAGLEGYEVGKRYVFQRVLDEGTGKEHMRMFPNAGVDYYETCGPISFSNHFDTVGVEPVNQELAQAQKEARGPGM